jgi:hypothetical protein
MTGKRQNAAPNLNKDSTLYSVFTLYFAAIIIFVGGGDQLIAPTIHRFP